MDFRSGLLGGAVVVGLACLLGPVAGGATASEPVGPTPYFIYYFDEARPLHLDPGSLAIRPAVVDRAAGHGMADELVASLATRSVVEDIDEVVGVGNFVRARIEGLGDSVALREASTREAVGDIAGDPGVAFVSPVFMDERGLPVIITDEILVGIRKGEAHDAALAAFDAQGLAIVERDFAGLAGVYLLRSSSRNGFEVLEQANALVGLPGVLYSEPNVVARGQTTGIVVPNDPLFSQQWALDQANDIDMDGPEAWAISTGDASIVTAILDVGVQFDHPDLNNAPGIDLVTGVPNGGPSNIFDNHGTTVAGTISGILDNGIGIVGGAPGTRTASVKIGIALDQFGFFDTSASVIASGLNWALTSGARITNSSYTWFISSTIDMAYNSTREQGLIHFASSGNNGGAFVGYPALIQSVNAVGAITPSGERANFSQIGLGLQFVAPGQGIVTTDRTGSDGFFQGDYALISGTSYSSPYAASVAALILSINPDLTADQVEQMMRDTAVDMGTPGYDTTFGWGRVNLFNAALAARQTVVAPWCAADYNRDGVIDSADLGLLLNNFGCVVSPNPCAVGSPNGPGTGGCALDPECQALVCAISPTCCSFSWFESCGTIASLICSILDCSRTDVTGDGITNTSDLGVLLAGFGEVCD